jgi:hypothetical protein
MWRKTSAPAENSRSILFKKRFLEHRKIEQKELFTQDFDPVSSPF